MRIAISKRSYSERLRSYLTMQMKFGVSEFVEAEKDTTNGLAERQMQFELDEEE
jgi:hypothetical protein